MTITTNKSWEVGDRVRIENYSSGLMLNGKSATISSISRSGYSLEVEGLNALIYFTNQEAMMSLCSLNATSVQESVPDLPSKAARKSTPTVKRYSTSDTPELKTMVTSAKAKSGRPKKIESISFDKAQEPSSPLVLTVNPSTSKETAEEPTTPAIVSSTANPTLWISPEQLEEVSFTQIREAIDNEAIARYAELMQSDLWDFERSPLPVVFEHENRYLIGDGHHRIEAARKIGADIFCEIFTATQIEEAILYSVTAIENSRHGIPLRPKDQRKRISMFLDLLESGLEIKLPSGFDVWSSRAIATYLRLPESGYRTIANIRKERERLSEEVTLTLRTPSNHNQAVKNSHAPDNPVTDIRAPAPIPSQGRKLNNQRLEGRTSETPFAAQNDLTNEELEARSLKTKITAIFNQAVNQLIYFSDEQIESLSQAIDAEKVRRSNDLMK